MSKPETEPEAEEPFLDAQGIPRSKLYLEKQKLDLEIGQLKRKGKSEVFLAFVPLFTVVLSLIGLGVGFWQFLRQQDKWAEERKLERTAQEQKQSDEYIKQLRSDVDEISKFTQDKTNVSRISFLLDDVKILASAAANPEAIQATESYKKALTEAMAEQLVNDADFMHSSRDVIFANKIVTTWAEYREYLERTEQKEKLNTILYRYVRALRYLQRKNPAYFKALSYDEDQVLTLPKEFEKSESEEILYQHIKYLLEGFTKHQRRLLCEGDSKTIQEKSQAFGDAVCNQSVARHLLEAYFVPRPCMR